MKYLLVFLSVAIALAGLLAAGCSGNPEAPPQIIKDATAPEAFTLIQQNKSNPDFVIVDVRTPGEFAQGHIATAINIDVNSANFQDDIGKLDRNKVYLVYCQTGVRSRRAADIMQKLGFKKLYNLSAGITQWAEAGYPTVK